MSQKNYTWDFPGGAVDKNRLPMQGTQVTSLVREIPQETEHRSPCTMTSEPRALEPET